MFGYLWALLTDRQVFAQWCSEHGGVLDKLKLQLRGLVSAAGYALVQGQVNLGPAGYFLAPVIGYLSGAIGHGDKNIPLLDQFAALTQEQKAAIVEHLRGSAPGGHA